jgi:hypothetical protein
MTNFTASDAKSKFEAFFPKLSLDEVWILINFARHIRDVVEAMQLL